MKRLLPPVALALALGPAASPGPETDPEEVLRRFAEQAVPALNGVPYPCDEQLQASADAAGARVLCVRIFKPFDEFVVDWDAALEKLEPGTEIVRPLPWQVSANPGTRSVSYTFDGVPVMVMFLGNTGDLLVTSTGPELWRAGKRTVWDLVDAVTRARPIQIPRDDDEPPSKGPYLAGVSGVTNPRAIHPLETPVYPVEARESKTEAQVILQAVIYKDGTVGELSVIRCSAPDLGFEQAAIEAVLTWRYEPATLDGVPVDVYFTVVVDFSLE